MKIIKDLAEKIREELEGAKDYANAYVEKKARGENDQAGSYKKMAQDELDHASRLHEIAIKEIQTIEKVYKAPEEMQEAWRKTHADYIERAAWIKQILTL